MSPAPARPGARDRRRCRPFAAILALCALVAAAQADETVPQYGGARHLGVASCASSQCHGAAKPYAEGNILRNEYRVWSREDRHAKAYETLLNEQSRSIARRMGLPNAHQAKVCLDCHADNVPPERRGEKFQLEDGVGCEACHGGGERWIKSHTEEGASHADNLARGMYPTEAPRQRAKVCLSCHYGDANKFATHQMMAAGHPRLSFELDTFTIRQEHYQIDGDYRERKRFTDSVGTWAAGIAAAAAEQGALLRESKYWSRGLFPELALFDCHACHHAMNDRRWSSRATTAGLPPGAVRLNDSSLVMLYAIAATVDPAAGDALLGAIRRLHEATGKDRDAVLAQDRELERVVTALQQRLSGAPLERRATAAVRLRLVELGAKGEFRDYTGAEQAAMALDLLTFALGEDEKLRAEIDRLFALLEDEAGYSPADFAAALAQMRKKLG